MTAGQGSLTLQKVLFLFWGVSVQKKPFLSSGCGQREPDPRPDSLIPPQGGEGLKVVGRSDFRSGETNDAKPVFTALLRALVRSIKIMRTKLLDTCGQSVKKPGLSVMPEAVRAMCTQIADKPVRFGLTLKAAGDQARPRGAENDYN